MSHQNFTVGVKLLIKNTEGKYLLLLKDAKYCHRFKIKTHWDIPGGRIDRGETIDQTMKRELKEELGITSFTKGKLLGVAISNFSKKFAESLLLVVFAGSIKKGTTITLDHEHTAYEWVSKTKAKKLLSDKYPPEFIKTVFA